MNYELNYAIPLPASLNQLQATIATKIKAIYQVKYFFCVLVSLLMPKAANTSKKGKAG